MYKSTSYFDKHVLDKHYMKKKYIHIYIYNAHSYPTFRLNILTQTIPTINEESVMLNLEKTLILFFKEGISNSRSEIINRICYLNQESSGAAKKKLPFF